MIRLFVLTNFLLLNLYACQGGYFSCIEKIKDSKTVQNSSLYIPVKNNKLLVYSKEKPKTKILKYDPFLSLYLIEDTKKFKYPFLINMRLQLGSAIVNDKLSKEGKIVKNQIGLNSLALYSTKLTKLALITSSCCSLEGIATPRGVIQKEYIKRFLSASPATYSDIGIRVKNENGFVVVSAANPYLENNPLQKGDCIVEFDSKKVRAASVFMRHVLFSKLGSKHTIKIKRGNKFMTFKVVSSKRYGGGMVSDTFLEHKGIYFDDTLHIVALSKEFIDYGLLLGDQLLQVNAIDVTNQNELLRYIENFKDFSLLLFSRRNFQFFVNIK
ncbi:PDZ domain-containing protein [Sulfurimonas sp. SAG-AH-194-L11]|nr:PDZ domain-containing protein [Sulfurimonas sp. SAG-AH-194-L11]MDF1876559.1 PDZ domain-containing protein [Sulfurimonas sp. SAG-AH-194-L11]